MYLHDIYYYDVIYIVYMYLHDIYYYDVIYIVENEYIRNRYKEKTSYYINIQWYIYLRFETETYIHWSQLYLQLYVYTVKHLYMCKFVSA